MQSFHIIERTARRPFLHGVHRAFTLLEVLLALAIIAMVSTVLIGGATHLLSDKPLTGEQVFWSAVREARKTALRAEHDIRLKFDREKKQFVLIDGLAPSVVAADGFSLQEAPIKIFPVAPRFASDLVVDFLAAGTGGSTILVRGVLIETRTVPYVTFYSDGTCSPFRAQFTRGTSAEILAVDPWTCAPMLQAADSNSPNARR